MSAYMMFPKNNLVYPRSCVSGVENKYDTKKIYCSNELLDSRNYAVAVTATVSLCCQVHHNRYEQDFTIATHATFKKDIASRLAHKDQYKMVERTSEKQIDLLIVVDQMLTGFDSKWINTLYMDKILQYENIIQAFSRTNLYSALTSHLVPSDITENHIQWKET